MSKHIETVQRIYQAFGAGDVATILTHLAKDVAWDQDAPSYGVAIYEPGSGHEHVLRFFQALGAVEFLRFEPKNFLSGGAQVAVPADVAGLADLNVVELMGLANDQQHQRSANRRSYTFHRRRHIG